MVSKSLTFMLLCKGQLVLSHSDTFSSGEAGVFEKKTSLTHHACVMNVSQK